jgi:peptide/nickel transport system substrate-binding protein
MTRRLALAAAVVALMLLAVVPAGWAQLPKRGGVLRIAEREAPSLDPHLTISFITHSHINLAYGQLVRFPAGPEQAHTTDFSIVPDVAERWTVSKDGTVYTFYLRRGVKFHNKPPVNGREVTAGDVKYSLERFMAKSAFRARFEPVRSIDAVDRYTVRITLNEPYAPFLNHLANSTYTAILAREVEQKFGDFNRPEAVIGTGPFVLKSYDKGVRLVFERNPDYFVQGLPYLDGVVIEITPDAAARLSLLRAGKVEFGHMWAWAGVEEGRSLQKTNPEIRLALTPVIGQAMIYFRTDQPPFNDVRVRRAVSLAIERKVWNESLLYGEGCLDSGPVPCAMKEWKLELAKLAPAKARYLVGYDLAEAKKLLAEAGYPKGFTTPAFHWPGFSPPWRSYYDLVVDDLSRIGITVELKPEEYGKWVSTTAVGKFEKMAISPSTPFTEIDDWLYGLHFPELSTNRSHVADADLNKLLMAQRREMDPKRRREIVDDIQRYLADKAYYVYLPWQPQYIAHQPSVKGFRHHDGYGLGYRLMHTWFDR